MRGECESAADKRRRNVYARVQLVGSRVRDDDSCRDANERVNDIPNAIDIRDLVGEEFDEVKKTGDADNPPVVENVEPAGKLSGTELLEQAENGDCGVEIDAGGPG